MHLIGNYVLKVLQMLVMLIWNKKGKEFFKYPSQ